MQLPDDAAWRALATRDARFDGRLFVGVTSTGIYCRPVCRVRTPRRENCRFFTSRAQAEAAAFRPCLKCRPEIAPGLSSMDAPQTLGDAAARWLDAAVQRGDAAPLPLLARHLGVSTRHLRRVFHAAHGVAPLDYLTTQRLLLAKQLLTDTAQPVTQVALASGYGSLRRFNAAFADRYRLNPTQLRRAGSTAGARRALRLAWRPPLDADSLLGHFARDAIDGVEFVAASTLRRTLALPHRGGVVAGWIDARFVAARGEIELQCCERLAPALGALLQRVRAAFDIDAEPSRIDAALAALPLATAPGTRVPGSFDGFEGAARAVVDGAVGAAAARRVAAQLVQRFGEPIATPWPALNRLFPDAATIAAADPAALGDVELTPAKAGALQALAAAVVDGRVALDRGAPLAATLAALRALPGIGEATVQRIALRVLGWPDAWPLGRADAARRLGVTDAAAARRTLDALRPWRGYAAVRLTQPEGATT